MQIGIKQHKKLFLIGLLATIVYWLLTTICFPNLFSEVSFIQALVNPGIFHLSVRIIIVLIIIGFSIYASKLLKQENYEKLALQKQLESKKHSFATADTPIIILNESLRILDINKATARLIGTTAEDLIMANVITTLFYKSDHEKIEKALQNNQNKPDPDIGSVKLRVKHGKNCWINFTTAIEYDKEKISKIYLLLHNVTHLVEQLTKIEDSQKALEEITTTLEKEIHHKNELGLEIDRLQEVKAESDNKIEILQSEISRLTEQHETLLNEQELLATDNHALQLELATVRTQIAEITLPILQIDPRGVIHTINSAAQNMLGIDKQNNIIAYLGSKEQKDQFDLFLNNLKQSKDENSIQLFFTVNGQNISFYCHGAYMNEIDQFLIWGYETIQPQLTQQEIATSLDYNHLEVNDLLDEMEEKKDQTRTVLNSIDDGIIIADLYNRITMMNPAAEDILGIRLSQVLERPIHFIFGDPQLLEELRKTRVQGLSNNKFQLETYYLNNNQSIKLDIKAVVIKNRHFREQGILLVLKKINN